MAMDQKVTLFDKIRDWKWCLYFLYSNFASGFFDARRMNSLEIYSEIFIGFAGFSGVVAALGVRNDSVWSVVDRNRFIILIFASFSGVFLSLVPQIIQHYTVDQKTGWQLALFLISIFLFISVAAVTFLFWRTGAFTHPEFSKPFMFAAGIILNIYSGIAFLAALDIHFEASLGIYAIGLMCIMLVSAGMFSLLVRLILRNV